MNYDAKLFEYEYALVCKNLPSSLVNGLSLEQHDPVDVEKAKKEHNDYLLHLVESGVKLIEISAQEEYPDCVFVEDTAVALNNKILITNPGAESRRGETLAVAASFVNHSASLGLEVFQIKDKEGAFIDGGDVCFTGREFLVGLSKRTNLKGAQELAEVFKPIGVRTCHVDEGLHLKSIMSMISPDVILIGTSPAAKNIRQQIEANSPFSDKYRFVEIDEDQSGSANILSYNGHIVYSSSFEHLYKNMEDFKNCSALKKPRTTKSLPNREFKKIDGCLTCRCVFFNKKK